MWELDLENDNDKAPLDIVVRRQPEADLSDGVELAQVVLRVSGCGPKRARYRDNLMLLACNTDNSWRIYDLNAAERVDDPKDHRARIWGKHEPGLRRAEFSPDGRSVITVGLDDIRIWDVSGSAPDPIPVELRAGSTVDSYDISGDSRLIAAVPQNGPARVWNFQGDLLVTYSPPGAGERLDGVRFFNGGRHLVFAGWNERTEEDFYVPWTVNLDEMFDTFNWLPPLEPSELEKLGLQ